MDKHVLIVDDSEDDILLLRHVLEAADVVNPITVLRDGEQALAYLTGGGQYADRAKHPLPDVLILDLRMPLVDGFEVLQWIKQQSHLSDMLLIVLSGAKDVWTVARAYDLGARVFLTKPCTREDVGNLIKTHKEYWMVAESAVAP